MADLRKKRLIIVEDNTVNLKILIKILQNDYELLTAGNGQEAMDILYKAEEESISAIVLDIIMPVMDGFEVLRRMRANTRFAKIPVIVASGQDGNSDDDKEIQALSLGANDYVTKPYKPEIIKHRIANAIYLHETATFVNNVRYDSLTGLCSKEYFYMQMNEILKQSNENKYDLICCDIEKFKLVNDLRGIDVGDKLIKFCAEVFKRSVKNYGICGRIGIDVFAFLVPHNSNYEDKYFIKYVDQVKQFTMNVDVQLRYGIYEIDDATVPVNIMCDYARLACNSIKGKYGVNFAYYNKALRDSMLIEQKITSEMKKALKKHEFQVYYQPKYDIATEKVVGAEALVRWIHPNKGIILPGKFIPLFERNGFITELDMYIWESVCSDLNNWEKSGIKTVPISVNVSRIDIYNQNLEKVLLGLIRKYNIQPNMLHLEVTETAYGEDSKQLMAVLAKLRSLGFPIEMDDFGSGYSSLNMLSELPVNIIKLDMKFLQTNNNNIILSFVISLAKWLGLPVIAEGVETKEQVTMLRDLGCNYAQGYCYAKPMPKVDFEGHIENKVLSLNHNTNTDQKENHLENTDDKTQKEKNKHNLLIVDDVEVNRCILSEYLSKEFNIIEKSNGKDAYEYIKKHYQNLDIIILDLIMPIMDGFILLKKLKNNDRYKNIPVVVTSQGNGENEAKALMLGACDFLAKPYNKQVVVWRIKNVIKNARIRLLEEENYQLQNIWEMEQKAKMDGLTGLYNRTEFETQAIKFFHEGNKKATFIILDIDNFKLINDRLGHSKGDEALKQLANMLKECFFEHDLICRLGGDEFAVFVEGEMSQDDLNNRLSDLCNKLKFSVAGLNITSSVGACTAPKFGCDYQTLYENADMALLMAKRLGKNQFKVFDGETELPSHVLFRNMDWLMDEASDAVIVCDAENYELLYINDVACKIAGKSKKQCMGKTCYQSLWNLNQPCNHCIHIDKLTKEYCEHEIKLEDRKKSYIIKGKLVDWGGTAARIQYIQDNTDKAAIKKRLEDISRDQKRLLDFMPGGTFRYRADSPDTFDFISKNMLDMLGYTKEEFIQKFHNSFSQMVWHEDRARVLAEIENQVQSGDTDECKYHIEKANGELCLVHDVGKLVTDEDGSHWFYVTIINITSSPIDMKTKEKADEK